MEMCIRDREYYVAQQNYANYMDANKVVVLQSALTERERLQNDMNLAYQVYSPVATQLQVARAKVQEEMCIRDRVCVDKGQNVLRPAIIWCDSRAVP